MRHFFILTFCLAAAVFVVAGCSEQPDPSNVMLEYWSARVAADATRMQQLSCAAWEAQALIQARSFEAMNAQLEDVTCRVVNQSGTQAQVECEGRIVTSYDGENREWELTPYLLLQEQGEWRICGEA